MNTDKTSPTEHRQPLTIVTFETVKTCVKLTQLADINSGRYPVKSFFPVSRSVVSGVSLSIDTQCQSLCNSLKKS